jgi:aldose 1-epimerase
LSVELAAGDARLVVAPALGGSVARFTWRDRDVLRRAPDRLDTVRNAACYPLVPYSNRIRDARLTFAGRTYPLARNFGDHPHAIHGLGWQRAWDVIAAEEHRVQLELVHGAADDAWPWPFRAVQTFELAERALHATLLIESRADEPFPFGLGWHPFFPKSPRTELRFVAQSVWRNDATQIPVERVAVPAPWRFDETRPLDDVVLDQVFNGWTGSALLAQPERGLSVALSADRACGRFVVYAPAQRDFVALEPVTHETDAFNRAAAGAADTGMRLLPPRAAFSCTMRLEITPI